MTLPSIPLIDIREGGPLALLDQRLDSCKELIRASTSFAGAITRAASYAALPLGDHWSRAWLARSNNPYRAEIAGYVQRLDMSGVYALNLAYEWGCTSAVYQHADGVMMTRVLDWPFPALGKHVVIAHQRGSAGEFYNVTWPGVSGSYNAMAPRRFSVALNQAPMRRHGLGYPIDWYKNRRRMFRENGLPPAHLLRKTCEEAANYEAAKQMLCTTPIAIPVIYILAGAAPGEGCIIERKENDFRVRPMEGERVVTANHWYTDIGGSERWSAREPDSNGRSACALALHADRIDTAFKWFTPPVENEYSRLAMVADAKQGILRVIGTEGTTRVTAPFSLTA